MYASVQLQTEAAKEEKSVDDKPLAEDVGTGIDAKKEEPAIGDTLNGKLITHEEYN